MRALTSTLPVLLGLSLTFAGEARAQTTPTSLVTFTVPSGRTGLNQAACQAGETITARVDYNGQLGTGTISGEVPPELVVYRAKNQSCPTSGVWSALPDDVLVLETRNLSVTDRTVPITIDRTDIGADTCPANTTLTAHFCAVVHQPPDQFNFNDTVIGSQRLTVTYDSEPPSTPTGVSATGGEQTIYLSWTSENVARFHVYYRPVTPPVDQSNPCPPMDDGITDAGIGVVDAGVEPDAGSGEVDSGTAEPQSLDEFRVHTVNDGSVRRTSIPNLENDRIYELYIVAEDAAGNRSPESAHVFAEPQVVADFYRRYRCQGGGEEGGFGCSTSGVAMAPLAGLLALALLRRTRKHS